MKITWDLPPPKAKSPSPPTKLDNTNVHRLLQYNNEKNYVNPSHPSCNHGFVVIAYWQTYIHIPPILNVMQPQGLILQISLKMVQMGIYPCSYRSITHGYSTTIIAAIMYLLVLAC